MDIVPTFPSRMSLTFSSEKRIKYLEFFYFFVFIQLKKEHGNKSNIEKYFLNYNEKLNRRTERFKKHYTEITKKEINTEDLKQKVLNYFDRTTFEKELIRLPPETLEKIIDDHIRNI